MSIQIIPHIWVCAYLIWALSMVSFVFCLSWKDLTRDKHIGFVFTKIENGDLGKFVQRKLCVWWLYLFICSLMCLFSLGECDMITCTFKFCCGINSYYYLFEKKTLFVPKYFSFNIVAQWKEHYQFIIFLRFKWNIFFLNPWNPLKFVKFSENSHRSIDADSLVHFIFYHKFN